MTPWQHLNKPLLVIGGAALDITATASKTARPSSILHTSTPGHVRQTLGGVGRNVCEAAVRTGAPAFLISVVGDDLAGRAVCQGLIDVGMDTQYVKTQRQHATAVYNALHSNDGQLVAAVADMAIFDSICPDDVATILEKNEPQLVCFDGNITSQVMFTIASQCHALGVPAFFEPTSVPKSIKIFDQTTDPMIPRSVLFTSPNEFELEAMCDAIATTRRPPLWPQPDAEKTCLPLQWKHAPPLAHRMLPYALQLSSYIPHVITKLGAYGCLYVGNCGGHYVAEYVAPDLIQPNCIKNVTGAGDSFVGTLLANLWCTCPSLKGDQQINWRAIISRAQKSAVLSLQSSLAVSPAISNVKLL